MFTLIHVAGHTITRRRMTTTRRIHFKYVVEIRIIYGEANAPNFISDTVNPTDNTQVFCKHSKAYYSIAESYRRVTSLRMNPKT